MSFTDKTRRVVEVALASTKAMEEVLSTAFQQDVLDIVGKGHGVNKTETGLYGIVVTEDFGINDELFLHWQVPQRMDKTVDFNIHTEWAPLAAESGKTMSLEVRISQQGEGTLINDMGEVFLIEDISVPDTAFESFSITLTVPKRIVVNGFDDLYIRIRRITSSNDSASDAALHHASIEYQIHQV